MPVEPRIRRHDNAGLQGLHEMFEIRHEVFPGGSPRASWLHERRIFAPAEGVEELNACTRGAHRSRGMFTHRGQCAVEITEICRSLDRQSAQHGYGHAVPSPVAPFLQIDPCALELLE